MWNRDKRTINDVIDILGRSSAKIKSSTSQYEADQHRRNAMASIDVAVARKSSKLPILLVVSVVILASIFFILPSGSREGSLTEAPTISSAQGSNLTPMESDGCGCDSSGNQDSQGFVSTQPESDVQQCFLYNEKGNFTRVNVRYYPGLDSEIIGQYADFTPVTIDQAISSEVADGYEWTQVSIVESGLVGWAVSAKIQCDSK
jgi:hypothetical protein